MSSEWRSYRLDEAGRIVTGKTPKGNVAEYVGRDVPFVTPPDFDGSKWIDETARRISKAGALSVKSSIVPAGSVLVTCIGSDMGKAALTRSSCVTNQQINAVVVDEDRFCPEFLYYNLSLRKDEIRGLAGGSAQPILNKSAFGQVRFDCPPLLQQKAIAAAVGPLDNRITLLRETNATLEAIAQTLFKSWFVDFDPVRAKAEGRQPEGMDATTAALFPDSFEESELGLVPKGWSVAKFEEFIERLSVGQKYDQKSANSSGLVPILDQGKSGIIGYHNDAPGVCASLETPVVVFANHTCYMRLICFDFSAIQNVLPFKGRGVDSVWAFYATRDRVKFSEYKGHWPDFSIEKSVVPTESLTNAFRDFVDPLVRKMRLNDLQAQALSQLRDTLLPRLVSGQLRLPEAEALIEEAV
ncbi:restriction endonuclease subunit S [Pseudomonas sp. 10-1B]|uniref:restriction endonuclease subunit S n=1 Tax=Pseudomonas sp. 10-1B TaxID=1546029 RepID=UPI0009E219AD|nr:restriction endonuclease subunit S [Pseudomonas sp. 10-1B]